MRRDYFRALHILKGADRDAHDRQIGSDWRVVRLGEDDDGSQNEVTTDCVRASEYGDLVPGTERGMARLIAVALNEALSRRSWPEWAALLAECEKGEPPPEPRAPVICEVCGKEGATWSSSPAGDPTFHHHHAECRLPGDDLPF